MSTTNCRIRCISLWSKRPELDLCRPLTVRARGTLSIDRVILGFSVDIIQVWSD